MPANLSPEYKEAEGKYREAGTDHERLAALQGMLSTIPKHKGTEKLQAGLKSRISKLRRQPRQKGAAKSFSHHIPKEGAAQIALIGPPNGGKSALVAGLTRATPEVAEYPFTTREALPGMMPRLEPAVRTLADGSSLTAKQRRNRYGARWYLVQSIVASSLEDVNHSFAPPVVPFAISVTAFVPCGGSNRTSTRRIVSGPFPWSSMRKSAPLSRFAKKASSSA